MALEATIKENDFEEGKRGICGFFKKASTLNISKHETKKGKFQNENFSPTLQCITLLPIYKLEFTPSQKLLSHTEAPGTEPPLCKLWWPNL